MNFNPIVAKLIQQNPPHKPTSAHAILKQIRNNPNGRVIALDIDLTSAVGNDTNDILRIIALMTRNFSMPGIQNEIRCLLDLLINPRLFEAISTITEETGARPFIVFYTQKGGIVNMCADSPLHRSIARAGLYSCGRNTLAFRAGRLEQGADYLFHQLRTREPQGDTEIYVHLRRVGILTWFISQCLGLSYAAPVYITRTHKNVEVIGKHLRIDSSSKIYLFDDNARHHAAALKLQAREANMIEVQPFDFHTMDRERRIQLHSLLHNVFPITQVFKEQIPPQFFLSIHDSSHHSCSSVDDRGEWKDLSQIETQEETPEPWDVSLVLPVPL